MKEEEEEEEKGEKKKKTHEKFRVESGGPGIRKWAATNDDRAEITKGASEREREGRVSK